MDLFALSGYTWQISTAVAAVTAALLVSLVAVAAASTVTLAAAGIVTVICAFIQCA